MDASGECRLICIDPARAREFWPYCEPMIRAAMARGGVGALAPVKDAVLGGRALLWIAWDGAAITAAAVTELSCTERRKFCVIIALGGRRMTRWLDLLESIEAYARAEGCDAVRLIGRTGWARVLRDFRRTAIVMDKELNDGRNI